MYVMYGVNKMVALFSCAIQDADRFVNISLKQFNFELVTSSDRLKHLSSLAKC